jgi:hypothetical protein
VLFDFDRNASAQQFIFARPNDDFPVFLPDGTRSARWFLENACSSSAD